MASQNGMTTRILFAIGILLLVMGYTEVHGENCSGPAFPKLRSHGQRPKPINGTAT